MKYAIYNTQTGLIFSTMGSDYGYLEIDEEADGNTYYVHNSTVLPRPATAVAIDNPTVPADGTTELLVSNLSPDTEIQIDGPVVDSLTATEKTSLTFSVPGAYIITATAPFPAMPTTIEIEATDGT